MNAHDCPLNQGFLRQRRDDSYPDALAFKKIGRDMSSFIKTLAARLPRRNDHSNACVNVLVPASTRTLRTADLCVQSIRRHLMHPVCEIALVGPPDAEIIEFCQYAGVSFLNESLILSGAIQARIEALGVDATRLKSQLAKLAAPDYLGCETAFICEAETILIRDQTFLSECGQVVYVDERRTACAEDDTIRALLGDIGLHRRRFSNRNLLLDRACLRELRAFIEERSHRDWFDAILDCIVDKGLTTFSEYELYGNFLWNFRSDRADPRYAFHRKCAADAFVDNLNLLSDRHFGFNSVSLIGEI